MSLERILALSQAIYFAITGLWPIVHMRSFLAVTGPKADLWLVKTVGVLVTAVAIPVGLAGWHDRVTPEVMILAIGSAAGLGAVDLIYSLRRVISKIYLVDALAEAALVLLWLDALLLR